MLKICVSLKKIVSKITRICCLISACIMCALVTLQIVFRIFHVGFGWTDEISRYCMVWMAMFGASMMVAENADVRLEFVTKRMPKAMARVCEAVNNVLIIIFLCVLCYYGFEKAISAAGIYATSVKISMMWFYLAVPVGSVLMLVQLLCRIVIDALGGKDTVDKEAVT